VGSTAESYNGAIGEDNLESEDIVSGDSVFEAAGATCIGGDISPESGFFEAGGIRGIEKVSAGCGRAELGCDYPRLDDSEAVFCRNFKNPIHFYKGENQSTPNGDAATYITSTGPAGGDRNSVTICESEDFGNLGCVSWEGDGRGKGGSHPGVGGVGLKGDWVEAQDTFWQ